MKLYHPTKGFIECAATDERKGAFVGWFLSPRSAQDIADWATMMGVPNPVEPDEMHATIMYSPEVGLSPERYRNKPLDIPVSLTVHHLPRTQILGKPGDAGALTTVFDSSLLRARHHYWEEEGLRHSFPEYIPHITLSYDASVIPREVLNRLLLNPCPLPFDFDTERVNYCHSPS